jgi:hypothetical protein
MTYILMGESFQMVDGPYKGKKYERGKRYDDIPPTEKKRFEDVGTRKSERGARSAEAAIDPSDQADPSDPSAPKVKPAQVAAKKNAASDDKSKAAVKAAEKEG